MRAFTIWKNRILHLYVATLSVIKQYASLNPLSTAALYIVAVCIPEPTQGGAGALYIVTDLGRGTSLLLVRLSLPPITQHTIVLNLWASRQYGCYT